MLQDGGYGDPQRVVKGKRLDSEGGSQRCILHSPRSSTPSFEIISTFPEIFPYISDLSSKTFETCTAARKVICWLGN